MNYKDTVLLQEAYKKMYQICESEDSSISVSASSGLNTTEPKGSGYIEITEDNAKSVYTFVDQHKGLYNFVYFTGESGTNFKLPLAFASRVNYMNNARELYDLIDNKEGKKYIVIVPDDIVIPLVLKNRLEPISL